MKSLTLFRSSMLSRPVTEKVHPRKGGTRYFDCKGSLSSCSQHASTQEVFTILIPSRAAALYFSPSVLSHTKWVHSWLRTARNLPPIRWTLSQSCDFRLWPNPLDVRVTSSSIVERRRSVGFSVKELFTVRRDIPTQTT